MDVETACLYGDLEEEVYMDCPEGMVGIGKDEALLLQSTIYGLVQSARQYYKKATSILKDLGFTGGTVLRPLFVLPRNRKRKSLLWAICRWKFLI